MLAPPNYKPSETLSAEARVRIVGVGPPAFAAAGTEEWSRARVEKPRVS